ncbi:hypothetical protein HY640_01310 [Candidatus Woesearchaeota archaeon]|nr:hypothetical protein [Candidatus Woesearchaeota archaeon]
MVGVVTMFSLRILNSKQVREIMGLVESQWGASVWLDYAFLMNSKDRVFVVDRSVGSIDFSGLRINSAGLYFGELSRGRLRLTIEGSQIVGPHATRNVIDVDDAGMMSWLRGNDLSVDCTGCSGFVIVRHGRDFLGCGLYRDGTIKNYVPKTRRVMSAD